MAVLPPKRGSQRRPALRGNILQDTTRGVERTRKWPDKRGSRQTRGQLDQQEWFRQANWAFKLMDPKSQAILRHAAEGTSLYPRDVFSIMASGGFFALVMEDGKVAYPMATIQAVSESLDSITQTIGYTLVRGPQFWHGAPPAPGGGPLATRLVMDAPKALPPSGSVIQWDRSAFNELEAWDPIAKDRLTVPASVLRVTVGASIRFDGGAAGNVSMDILRNGALVCAQSGASGYVAYNGSIVTGPLDVAAGDYFQLRISRSNTAAKVVDIAGTAFYMTFG